jgi:hypothetical protein
MEVASVFCSDGMLIDRVGEISGMGTSSRTMIMATLSIAGCLYGGVRLASWHTVFKTSIEEYLWKISAISIAASGPFGVFVIFVLCSWDKEYEGDVSLEHFMTTALLMFVMPARIAVYVLASVYLIAGNS